jgi:hypothetical protein
MKIYELLSPSAAQATGTQTFQGQNPEDDEEGKFDANKVDQNLQQVSQDINSQKTAPEPVGGQQEMPPELDAGNVKPIDDALLSQIKTLPYTKKYNFKDNDPLNPIKIAGMEVQQLSDLKSKVRLKMQMATTQDGVGLDDDKNMIYYTDLMRIVNTVMHFKKTNTASQLAQYNPSPSYQSV